MSEKERQRKRETDRESDKRDRERDRVNVCDVRILFKTLRKITLISHCIIASQ